MTSVQFTTTRNFLTPVARLIEALKGVWQSYQDWRARRATLQILGSLSDIGLHRDEIESVVCGRRGDRKRWYDANWRRRSGK